MRENPTSRQIANRAWADAHAPAIVAVCALLVGVAVRLALYFQNVSLWFDEIGVALSVATRSRFDMDTAPPLYLWIERMSALAGGINEAALRLPALLAGLIALVCIAWLGFRAGGSWVAAIAAALAAFSANLCRCSNELKPYGIDAAVSAVLLLSAMSVLNGGGSRLARLVLFAAGLLCIPLSTPSVFVLAGIVIALILNAWRPGSKPQLQWSQFLWIGAAALAWAFLFLTVYRAFYAPIAASEYMRRFWAGALVTPSSGPHRIITAITDALVIPVLGLQTGTFPIRIMGLTFLFAGVWAAFRRSGAAFATLLCAPVAVGIGAALMGHWYLRTRLMLFSAPETCVLMAMGVWQLSRWVPEPLQLRALWIVSIVALILPVKHTLSTISHPERQGFRGLVAAAIGHAQPGDVIYIYPRTAQAWTFYSVDWRHNGLNVAEPMMATILRSGPNSGNMPSRHAPVIHEGFDWRFERAGRIELFGVATGIMSNTFGTESAPDPGWADNEIDRMLNERSAKRFWILASDASGLDSLLQRLSERGFSVDLAYEGPGPVLLYRALHSAAPK